MDKEKEKKELEFDENPTDYYSFHESGSITKVSIHKPKKQSKNAFGISFAYGFTIPSDDYSDFFEYEDEGDEQT